jgi:hypothetical protein
MSVFFCCFAQFYNCSSKKHANQASPILWERLGDATMKLTERIKQHPWLFGCVCGIPLIAHIGVLIWIATATNYSGPNTSEIPTYAWVLAFAILPVLSAIVSVAMTWFLAWCTGTAKYANTPLARLYGFVFAVPWILLFGYLGFFAFAMGLGSPPAPTSMTQFFNRISYHHFSTVRRLRWRHRHLRPTLRTCSHPGAENQSPVI